MHAAHLVTELVRFREANGLPPAIIEGNGSTKMEQAGVQLLFDVRNWGAMGVIANIARARYFIRVIRATAQYIISNQPDMVVLVDSRFLNTNLAKLLRQQGYSGKIVYYIAPVKWQSCYDPSEHSRSLRSRRFLAIKEYCDFAIPVYPVSLKVYEELLIPHEYVGHPLCQIAKPVLSNVEFAGITGIAYDPAAPPCIIGALPGSRKAELKHIAPVIFGALALMKEAFDEDDELPELQPVCAVAHGSLMDETLKSARDAGLTDLVILDSKYVYDLMHRSQLMLVKSGTGVHECMLMGIPVIMAYKVHPALAWLMRYMVRFSMPYYSLPNLLANAPVVPELVQEECNYRRIAEVGSSLMFETEESTAMLRSFAELRELVCRPSPLKRTCEIITEMIGY